MKTLLFALCRLCRYVSFSLRDTRHFYVSFVSSPFGVTQVTQARSNSGEVLP